MRAIPFIACRYCGALMSKDENSNYGCVPPGCGRGSIAGPNGVSVEIDADGNMTIMSKSANGQADQG